MFQFNAHIVKRKKINYSLAVTGLIATALLGYFGLTYLDMGHVPSISRLLRQIGILQYSSWVYGLLFISLLIPAYRMISMFMQKKIKVNGAVAFDEEKIHIVKGKDEFVIPEEDLTEINFELAPLPKEGLKDEDKLFGGSFMKIPTKKGTFTCELDLNSPLQREKLIEMGEFLKIQHDVKVKVKQLK